MDGRQRDTRTRWTRLLSVALALLAGVSLLVGGCSDDPDTVGSSQNGDDDDTPEQDTMVVEDIGDMDAGDEAPDTSDDSADTTDESDAGGDSSPVDSGLDGTETVENLDDGDAREICEAGEEYVRSKVTQDDLCLFGAHLQTAFQDPETDEQAQQACSDAKSSCTDQEKPSAEEVCRDLTIPGGCSSITVDQWEACEAARTDQFAMAISEVPTCTDVTADFYNSEGGIEPGSTPEACQPIDANCPELLQDIGPTRSSGAGGN